MKEIRQELGPTFTTQYNLDGSSKEVYLSAKGDQYTILHAPDGSITSQGVYTAGQREADFWDRYHRGELPVYGPDLPGEVSDDSIKKNTGPQQKFVALVAEEEAHVILTTTGTSGDDTITASGLLAGGGGNDQLTGQEGSDILLGGSGNDRLDGGAGGDVLDGGAGADTMAGGKGDDTYYVDSASDVVFELGNEGTDTVHSTVSFDIHAWAIENVVLEGVSNASITGNYYNNVLTGNAGHNYIYAADGNDTVDGGAGHDTLYGAGGNDSLLGGAGNDVINGGDGNDIVYGGAGADYLDGGSGNDTLSYFDAQGGVTVKLWANSASGDIAQGDVISGFENVSGGAGGDWLEGDNNDNVLDGCAGGDLLIGMGGNDLLLGREGNDTLIADWGTDILEGGSGSDLFAIWATTQHAILNDFKHGEDHIQLSTSLFKDFAAIKAGAVQQGDDVLIARPGLDILLKHVQLSTLTASDFQFV
nr:calcium-binding protein [Microvirga puerhi]